MSKANPAVIGAFVLSAVFLGIAAVLILGGGELRADRVAYVAYFDESLKGLEVGAPVTVKGVTVGSVKEIAIVADIDDLSTKIPVVFEVDRAGLVFVRDGVQVSAPERTELDQRTKLLIERGMRAQLQTQSLVTGKKEIALDFHPDTPATLVGERPEYPELPTIPSSGEQLARTLDEIDIDEIADAVLETFEALRDLFEDPRIGRILDETEGTIGDFGQLARDLDESAVALTDDTRGALEDARGLIRNIDEQVKPVTADFSEALEAARVALEKASGALTTAEKAIAEDSPLQQEILIAIKEISGAARSVRMLAEYLERHPEAVLQGKGGQ
ncbi:MAG: MlaD family protein [Planctomycetota bacterium]|jgi:paraquat-inducible protein B